MKTRRYIGLSKLCLALMLVPSAAQADDEADALVRDALVIVHAAEQQVWNIDRYELERVMEDALLSLCRATGAVREGALSALDARMAAMGGPVERAYAARGKDLGAISELLSLHRARLLLAEAMKRAAEECPFYLQPRSPFPERQRAVGRGFLSSEGGGLMNSQLREGEVFFGGGGGGRIAYGHGLHPSWSLRVGVDMGGAGLVDKSLSAEAIDLDMYFGLPLVLRRRGSLWHQDLEIAPVAQGIPFKERLRLGARVAGLVGVTYPRLGSIQPWAGMRVAAAFTPAQFGIEQVLSLRLGLRFGFDLHLE